MTKVPWQTKGNKSGKQVFKATRPGQVVSVDQMISTQPGFVAQLKGKLTVQCYKAATIVVDHFSGLRFIHMMTNLSSDETIKAKQACEHFAANHFVTIEHYHADNGRFADNVFINHCSQRLPTVGSMPTSNMARLKEPSEISPKLGGCNSSMPWQDGHKW
jgi:hypothetical protein